MQTQAPLPVDRLTMLELPDKNVNNAANRTNIIPTASET